MKVIKTGIEGLVVIEPQIFKDGRGYFFESFNENGFARETGISVRFVQDNESRSSFGVLRGLHFQKPPYAQSKLVRVVSGKVLDVAVDLRKGSPTFGKHFSVELSGENHLQLFIPKGFAHGYCVLSEEAVFQYKCDEFYHQESEGGVMWNDPDLAIEWPLAESEVKLSDKDRCRRTFREYIDEAGLARRTVLVTGSDGQLGRSLYDIIRHSDVVSSVCGLTDNNVVNPSLCGASGNSDVVSSLCNVGDHNGTDSALKQFSSDGDERSLHGARWVFTARKDAEDIALDDLLDITSKEDIDRIIAKWSPDIIINCAAYTDVEMAETHIDDTVMTNVEAVSMLAEAAAAFGALLIHFSTDYVFNGEKKTGAYTENDEPHPINVYGMSKYSGELFAQKSGADVIVVRTSALFSEYGKNFVKTMCRLMSEKESVSVVNDQTVSPTYARDLAEFVVSLVSSRFAGYGPASSAYSGKLPCGGVTGETLEANGSEAVNMSEKENVSKQTFKGFRILNYSNEGMCTWYEFAEEISRIIGNETCSLNQCTSAEYPSRVSRPHFSVLDKTEAKSYLSSLSQDVMASGSDCHQTNEIPSWRDALARCLCNLGKSECGTAGQFSGRK